MVVVAGAGLLSASSPNYKLLIIYRCLVGFGVAGGHVSASWFMEFIPPSSRGAWMLSITTFWTLGTLMGASLAWVYLNSSLNNLLPQNNHEILINFLCYKVNCSVDYGLVLRNKLTLNALIE